MAEDVPPSRHEQLELPRFDKNGQRRGVHNTPRSGRPPKGERPGASHLRRPEHVAAHPVQVTLRVSADVPSLRTPDAYRAIGHSLLTVARREDTFRIVHISIQSNHIHALCEATDTMALARGLQSFQISAARQLNRALGRTGQVFADRYDAEAITTVRRARHALAYVLNNWRRHRCRDGGLFDGRIDRYASGVTFAGWREPLGSAAPPSGYEPLPVSVPRTWLLTEGYKRETPISVYDVPGARRARSQRANH